MALTLPDRKTVALFVEPINSLICIGPIEDCASMLGISYNDTKAIEMLKTNAKHANTGNPVALAWLKHNAAMAGVKLIRIGQKWHASKANINTFEFLRKCRGVADKLYFISGTRYKLFVSLLRTHEMLFYCDGVFGAEHLETVELEPMDKIFLLDQGVTYGYCEGSVAKLKFLGILDKSFNAPCIPHDTLVTISKFMVILPNYSKYNAGDDLISSVANLTRKVSENGTTQTEDSFQTDQHWD